MSSLINDPLITWNNYPHVISADQFGPDSIKQLLLLAEHLLQARADHLRLLLRNANKLMVELFYQPSTRTRLSFGIAMQRLGGMVISTENAKEFSSAAKGESLTDSIKTLNALGADVIVLRYHETGGAARAAEISQAPIINAGDGTGEHPTQGLLDLLTIKKELGRLDNFSIAFVGDIYKSRTISSLVGLLRGFNGVEMHFVAPSYIELSPATLKYLLDGRKKINRHLTLAEAIIKCDVVYMTRIQAENYADDQTLKKLSKDLIDYSLNGPYHGKAVIMHPLPRNEEIAPDLDQNPKSAYFRQVGYGLCLRMALLLQIFGSKIIA